MSWQSFNLTFVRVILFEKDNFGSSELKMQNSSFTRIKRNRSNTKTGKPLCRSLGKNGSGGTTGGSIGWCARNRHPPCDFGSAVGVVHLRDLTIGLARELFFFFFLSSCYFISHFSVLVPMTRWYCHHLFYSLFRSDLF